MGGIADFSRNNYFRVVKKLVAILMLVLYGMSSSGATVQFHYCCGKLKSVKFGTAPLKECGQQVKMGAKPCCETKELSAKNQDQQQEVYTIAFGPVAPVELPASFILAFQPAGEARTPISDNEYVSPPLSKSIFTFNCVFRV